MGCKAVPPTAPPVQGTMTPNCPKCMVVCSAVGCGGQVSHPHPSQGLHPTGPSLSR